VPCRWVKSYWRVEGLLCHHLQGQVAQIFISIFGFCGLWDFGVPSSKDEFVPVRNMRHVIKTCGSGGTAPGIHKVCFRCRRKISFTRPFFYPTPDERATGSHWLEVLISPIFPLFPPVTGRTAIMYARSHLRRSALDIFNLEDERTALSRNVGHHSSCEVALFFKKNTTKFFLQKLVYQKFVSCYSVRPLIVVDFATPVNGPCCRGHGRVDFPLYANFQLGGICHHQTIAWFYAGSLCGHILAKLSLLPLRLLYVGLGRQFTTFTTNGLRNT